MKILDYFKKPTPFSAYPTMTETSHTFQLPQLADFRDSVPTLDYDGLQASSYAGESFAAPAAVSPYTGGKFFGGFGETQLLQADYWTLRARSAQLFTENLYARGIIRRLITNEINTGLSPEAAPDEEIIGVSEDSLNEWSELTENRFAIWADNPLLCDFKHAENFGAIQRAARMEALVAGDVLVVLTISQATGLPQIQLIRGEVVQSPTGRDGQNLAKGHEIKHGVEFDSLGRVVAHWIRQSDAAFKRLPAYGSRTGRKISWLVYGSERRLDDVRGQPILALVLQSLKEIDRYRDSTQRKAVVNSVLAMFIEKSADKMGSLPMQAGATRRGAVVADSGDGKVRSFNVTKHVPGVVMDELQVGEKPTAFGNQGTDVNFGTFEASIVQAVAWSMEVPPEIMTLAFSNNYSASQAAINEFKIYLNKVWSSFGAEFCKPIYIEWILSETLAQRIAAPGLLAAWRDPSKFDVFGAWISSEWYGSIKPSTDMLKQAKGSQLLVKEGWSTNAREARIITGTKFSKNAKRLRRENQLKVDALRPIAEFNKEFNLVAEDGQVANIDDITASIDDFLAAASDK